MHVILICVEPTSSFPSFDIAGKTATTTTRSRTVSDATPPSPRTLPFNGNRPSSAPSSLKLLSSPAALRKPHPPSSARKPATSSPRLRKTLLTTPPTVDPPNSSTHSSEAFVPIPSPTTTTPAPTTAPSPLPTSTRVSLVSRTKAAVVSVTPSTNSVPFATLQAASLLLLAVTRPDPTFRSAPSGATLLLPPFDLLPLLSLTFPVLLSPLPPVLTDLPL